MAAPGGRAGLLEAVAEHGFTTFIATKRATPRPRDPIEDLRAGWELAIQFGLENPALFTLMYSEPTRPASPALKAGMEILMGRIRRLATSGRLRVDEELAAAIIHATARGAVLTWLSPPDDGRDPALLTTLRESMVAAVTSERPAVRDAAGSPGGSPERPESWFQTMSRSREDLVSSFDRYGLLRMSDAQTWGCRGWLPQTASGGGRRPWCGSCPGSGGCRRRPPRPGCRCR
jgi:hypothetical protein